MHSLGETHIKALEAIIAADSAKNLLALRLQTLPGVGKSLAPVIALEIDDSERFARAEKLL